jgi:hypothetical protein
VVKTSFGLVAEAEGVACLRASHSRATSVFTASLTSERTKSSRLVSRAPRIGERAAAGLPWAGASSRRRDELLEARFAARPTSFAGDDGRTNMAVPGGAAARTEVSVSALAAPGGDGGVFLSIDFIRLLPSIETGGADSCQNRREHDSLVAGALSAHASIYPFAKADFGLFANKTAGWDRWPRKRRPAGEIELAGESGPTRFSTHR